MDEEEEEEEDGDSFYPKMGKSSGRLEMANSSEIVENLFNSPFSLPSLPPPFSSPHEFKLLSEPVHPHNDSVVSPPSLKSSSSSTSHFPKKHINLDEKVQHISPQIPYLKSRSSSANRSQRLKSFARDVSNEEAEILLKALIDRGDVGNQLAKSVGSIFSQEMDEFSSVYRRQLDAEELLSQTAGGDQLLTATQLAPLASSILLSGITSNTATKKKKVEDRKFQHTLLEKLNLLIGSISLLRTSGNSHPPSNLIMSLQNRHVFGSVKSRLTMLGSYSTIVETQKFKENLINHIQSQNLQSIQMDQSNGAIMAHAHDNYVLVQNIQNKTLSRTCHAVHSITRMSRSIFPDEPIGDVQLDQLIDFERLENSLHAGEIELDATKFRKCPYPHISDYIHHRSLALKSGKFNDYGVLMENLCDIQGDITKPCFLVQDSEFQAHHLKMAYSGTLLFSNSVSLCPTWHLLKHLLDTFCSQPDFYAYFMSPMVGIVLELKPSETKKYLSPLYLDVDWKAWKKSHFYEGIDDHTADEERKLEIIGEEERKGDEDEVVVMRLDEFKENDELNEEEEEEEMVIEGSEIGGYGLRDRRSVNPKVFGEDFVYEDEMKEHKVLSKSDKKLKKSTSRAYPTSPPPKLPFKLMFEICRSLVHWWNEVGKEQIERENPSPTSFFTHQFELLTELSSLLTPLLNIYEDGNMASFLTIFPQYPLFFARFKSKYKFTRHVVGTLNTILELADKSPPLLSTWASHCLTLSELNIEYENNVVGSSVSKYRHELNGEILGDNLMIDSSLKRAEKASKIPRMQREYSRNYYTTCYSRYWGILISWAMKKASNVPSFKTTFPKSDDGLANLLEKQEEGKIKTDSYSRLSLEAYKAYLEKWVPK